MDFAEPPKKRRKGGIHQRLAAAQAEEHSACNVSSELGACLLEKWSWGQMSPQEVQDLASKAKRDFEKAQALPPQDIQFMASLGSAGAHKFLGHHVSFAFIEPLADIAVSCLIAKFCKQLSVPCEAKHAQGASGLGKQENFFTKGFHAHHQFQAALQ